MKNYYIFYISSSDVPKNLLLEGGYLLTNWPNLVTKKDVLENTLASSLVAWLTFTSAFAILTILGGAMPFPPQRTPSAQSGIHLFVPC